MNLRIGMIARLLTDGSIRGWNRYTINLVRSLAELGQAEIYLLTDRPIAPEHKHFFEVSPNHTAIHEVVSGPMNYLKWQERWVPRIAVEKQLDIIHTPYHIGLPWFAPCPTVATVHDAIDVLKPIPLIDQIKPRSLVSRFLLWETRKRASRIITVSRSSAWDLVRKLHIQPTSIEIITEAADMSFHAPISAQMTNEVLHRYGISDRPYLFYIGGLEQRKNIPFMIDALSKASSAGALRIVLAGGDKRDIEVVRSHAASTGMADRVTFLGRVPDSDLPSLYAGALALVYSSLWEGFGLQVVEAMAVGCAVLASSATSLPEVVGSGGVLFDPRDVESLSVLINRLATDTGWVRELREKSKARGKDFSWEMTGTKTLELYQALVKKV